MLHGVHWQPSGWSTWTVGATDADRGGTCALRRQSDGGSDKSLKVAQSVCPTACCKRVLLQRFARSICLLGQRALTSGAMGRRSIWVAFVGGLCVVLSACEGTVVLDDPSAGTGGHSSGGDTSAVTASSTGGAAGTTATGAGSGGAPSTVGVGGGGSTSSTGGGSGSLAPYPAFDISLVHGNGPWQIGQGTTGIVADDNGQVLINDEDNVYLIDGGQISTYLTTLDLNLSAANGFRDMDRGSDGAVYLLTKDTILRSDTPHMATVFRTLPSQVSSPVNMSMASLNDIGVVELYDELWNVGPNGAALVYNHYFGSNCTTEDLAIQSDGSFLYLLGCNGSPLTSGSLSGQTLSHMFKGFGSNNPFDVNNFNCLTREPSGGFYAVIRNSTSSQFELMHFTANVTQQTGFTTITTYPSLAGADMQTPTTFGLYFCSMATTPSGTIYLQSFERLWRLDPSAP